MATKTPPGRLRFFLSSSRDFNGGLGEQFIRVVYQGRTTYGELIDGHAIRWLSAEPPGSIHNDAIHCARDAGEHTIPGCSFEGFETERQMAAACSEWVGLAADDVPAWLETLRQVGAL
jgi:hypothetical protein